MLVCLRINLKMPKNIIIKIIFATLLLLKYNWPIKEINSLAMETLLCT